MHNGFNAVEQRFLEDSSGVQSPFQFAVSEVVQYRFKLLGAVVDQVGSVSVLGAGHGAAKHLCQHALRFFDCYHPCEKKCVD